MGRRERLAAEIRTALDLWFREPFEWGKGDCFLSLADIINRALGYDPAEMFRGRYATSRGAARATHAHGGFAGGFAYVAECAGWKEIKPTRAAVGDVGLIADRKSPRAGAILNSDGMWVSRTQKGFAAVPTSRISKAWRVQ